MPKGLPRKQLEGREQLLPAFYGFAFSLAITQTLIPTVHLRVLPVRLYRRHHHW